MKNSIFCVLPLFCLLSFCTCQNIQDAHIGEKSLIEFEIFHPSQTRVTSTEFEQNDKIGVWMRNQQKDWDVIGNVLNNEELVYNDNKWESRRSIYWKQGLYDVFAYYPYYGEIRSLTDFEFQISLDQRDIKNADSVVDGYEMSDFLWAQNLDVHASNKPIPLVFSHKMSRLVVRLVPTEDYEGEIPENASVRIHGTVVDALVDLSAGVVVKDPHGLEGVVEAKKIGDRQYAAIIVPQRLEYITPLVEVVAGGVSYIYDMRFVFKSGVQHTLTVYLSKNPEQIKIEIGGEIEGWD